MELETAQGGVEKQKKVRLIWRYLKKSYNLLIGERTAEQIKIQIGSAYVLDEPEMMEIKGRHLIEGVPKTITISDEEIREALGETLNIIVDAVRDGPLRNTILMRHISGEPSEVPQLEGKVSIDGAREDYGVVISDAKSLEVDEAATAALRGTSMAAE